MIIIHFSVANWRSQSVDFWLKHNGYTTMASPPSWAREHDRNLGIFVPPARIVFGDVTEEEYTNVYREVLKARLPVIEQWIQAHQQDHMILLCACPDDKFCHRHLIAKLLTWKGCEQVDIPKEIHPVNFCSCGALGAIIRQMHFYMRPTSLSYWLYTLKCPACSTVWEVKSSPSGFEIVSEEIPALQKEQ